MDELSLLDIKLLPINLCPCASIVVLGIPPENQVSGSRRSIEHPVWYGLHRSNRCARRTYKPEPTTTTLLPSHTDPTQQVLILTPHNMFSTDVRHQRSRACVTQRTTLLMPESPSELLLAHTCPSDTTDTRLCRFTQMLLDGHNSL